MDRSVLLPNRMVMSGAMVNGHGYHHLGRTRL